MPDQSGSQSPSEGLTGRKMRLHKEDAERAGGKLLRTQKQPRLTELKSETAPGAKLTPRTQETITLASGERRTVEIEGTDDNEWNALVALAETATTLSLDQKDITHRTIAAIAALRIAHEDDWKSYCQRRGMKWPKEGQKPVPAYRRLGAKSGQGANRREPWLEGQHDCGLPRRVLGSQAPWRHEAR